LVITPKKKIMKKLIITSFSNPSKEGVNLHLNQKGRLKTGKGMFETFYVSWDKIGQALFEDYAEPSSVDELRELRGEYADQFKESTPNDALFTKDQVLDYIDRCFHMYASSFRQDAREWADEAIDEYLKSHPIVKPSNKKPSDQDLFSYLNSVDWLTFNSFWDAALFAAKAMRDGNIPIK
jgi:hypothetical protein